MIKKHGEVSPMRMVSFSAVAYGLKGDNVTFQYNLNNGGVSAGSIFANGDLLDVYIMGLQGPQGTPGTDFDAGSPVNLGTYIIPTIAV